jgi:hypothetical protein
VPVTVTVVFSDTGTTCNALVPIHPKGLAFVPPSGEGLGAFFSDWYRALSVSIRDPNRRFGASGLDLGLSFAF